MRIAIAVATALLVFVAAASARYVLHRRGIQAPTTEFATVSTLMNDAIAAKKLPGGVVVIGHGGRTVFHEAYGSRTLAGEPGLDGLPAPAEPMTEDTIFDIASLTKCLATATAVMQLYEQGKVAFDDPVQKYLPDFNTANDPVRAQVTVRLLLTHTSGEPIDVNLHDPWGLDAADKAEGVHRALTTPLQSGPGEVFRYADINYILLGALIEKLTGQAEDEYVQQNVFAPLGMEATRYLPPAKACGPHTIRGAAIGWAPAPKGRVLVACPAGTWSTSLLPRIGIPTAIDDASKERSGQESRFWFPASRHRARPDGAAHGGSGRTRRRVLDGTRCQRLCPGVTGSGLQGARGQDASALKQATLGLMTTPQQSGHTAGQVRSGQRCRPRSNRKDAEHHGSATRSALSGDRGTTPVRFRLGYRHGLFQAARPDLSGR